MNNSSKYILVLLTVLACTFASCKKDKPEITVTDVDGNVYKTIKIGTQTWMAENLKTTKFNDGSLIPLVADNTAWKNLVTSGYCWYDNNKGSNEKYGALYNWYAVDARDANNQPKLAPKGWHVATDDEWGILLNYLTKNGYDYDPSTLEEEIAKSMASTAGWQTDSTPGNVGNDQGTNNKSGFNALPSGYRDAGNGIFNFVNGGAYWWSSTLNINDPNGGVYSYRLYYDFAFLASYYFQNKKSGLAIRCVKD